MIKIGDMIENVKDGFWNNMRGRTFIVSEFCDYTYGKFIRLYSIQDMQYLELDKDFIETAIRKDRWMIL